MSNVQRAAVLGVASGGAAAVLWLVVCWSYPAAIIPLVFNVVGTTVAYAPGYDESRPFRRKSRERVGTACSLLGLGATLAVVVHYAATHPGD